MYRCSRFKLRFVLFAVLMAIMALGLSFLSSASSAVTEFHRRLCQARSPTLPGPGSRKQQ